MKIIADKKFSRRQFIDRIGVKGTANKMEDLRIYRHILVLLGTVALICLMIGYFSQGWLVYDLRLVPEGEETVDVRVSRGLWATSGCILLNFTAFTHEACGDISENKMDKFIESSDLEHQAKVATSELFENFTKLRILLMFGGIHGIVGLIFSLFIHKGRNIFVKSRGYCCVYSWAASAVLVMTAVVLQAIQASRYNYVIDTLSDVTSDVKARLTMKATISKVMYISGTGSLIGVFMALVLLVKLCRTEEPQKPNMHRSVTQQTIEDQLSSSDEEDQAMHYGKDNLGFRENESGAKEGLRERDKHAGNGDLNIKYLMDIYM